MAHTPLQLAAPLQVTNNVKRNADNKEVARLKQVITMMSAAANAAEAAPAAGAKAVDAVTVAGAAVGQSTNGGSAE